MSPFRRRFRAGRDGVIVDLPRDEQEILGGLLEQLRDLVMADDDPTLRRLKPPARPDDDDAEAGYRGLVDDQLLRERLEGIERVEADLGGATLDDEGVAAWMHSLNNMRLILGERLELEGADLQAHDLGEHPVAPVYEWLGALLEHLVRAAMTGLPDGDD